MPVSIGDSYGGGTVAYILQAGDPGYDAAYQKGLIATSADKSTGIYWHVDDTGATGASATAIGSGNANTVAIVATYGAESNAAKLCSDLNEGSQTDWYLPSRDELLKLYVNRVAITGFSAAGYWSSTSASSSVATAVDFTGGDVYAGESKTNTYRVRAVRSFSILLPIPAQAGFLFLMV